MPFVEKNFHSLLRYWHLCCASVSCICVRLFLDLVLLFLYLTTPMASTPPFPTPDLQSCPRTASRGSGPAGQDRRQQLGLACFLLHFFPGGLPNQDHPRGPLSAAGLLDKISQSFPINTHLSLSQHCNQPGLDWDQRDPICSVGQFSAACCSARNPEAL